MSGLAAAGFLSDKFDCLLVERESELGGYCRTIYKDGFTWDYSGHFFHFRHKGIADYIHSRMDLTRLLTINRISRVYFRNQYIDFPFQFNIQQLPLDDFIHCLSDMYAANGNAQQHFSSFREMIHGRYGRSLGELFLIPYNEKLYSLPADRLDADAMGRFFPHINFSELLARIRCTVDGAVAGSSTYNAKFCYHRDGARAYVRALCSYVPDRIINVSTTCEAIDAERKLANISGEQVSYDRLVISAPLPSILRLAGQPAPAGLLTANKVLVFNLGFDRPSLRSDHWVYYPENEWVFFRIGHYDNILGDNRMSLYVEIAMSQQDEVVFDHFLPIVIRDLERAGVINGHKLVSWVAIVLDPAYAHVTKQGQKFAEFLMREANGSGNLSNWSLWSLDLLFDRRQYSRSLPLSSRVGMSAGPHERCRLIIAFKLIRAIRRTF